MPTEQYFGRACRTCRRRGRRCDRRMPSCETCSKKGLTCEGYLIRWSGIASRGKLAGKSVPITTASDDSAHSANERSPAGRDSSAGIAPGLEDPLQLFNGATSSTEISLLPADLDLAWGPVASDELMPEGPIGPLPDMSVPEGDLAFSEGEGLLAGEQDQDTDSDPFPVVRPLSPAPPCEIGHLGIPDEFRFILHYYTTEVVPKLCVDNGCVDNPYGQHILPLAVEVPSLLFACAALASCQLNVRMPGSTWENDFWRFKGKAMRRLQEDLYSKSRSLHPGTLATVLMLCLCEICQGGFSNFDTHFLGAKHLMSLRGKNTPLDNFVGQYLGWLDIMAAASHRRKPVFSPAEIPLFASGAAQWSFDVFPCPPDQFMIICQIVELHRSATEGGHFPESVAVKVEAIKHTLISRPIHADRGVNWLHLTEAYRFAILLYIARLFAYESDLDEIEWLVSSVFYHAKCTPPASGWSDQLLWPLFHVGLEITDSRRQTWLCDRFKCMRTSGGFGNVDSAMQVLQRVWGGQRPANYLDILAGDGTGSMLLV